MNLYTVSHEYATAMAKLEDSDFDVETIADTLEGMSGEVIVKAQNIVAYTLNMEADIAMIKEAENKMAERRKAIEARAAKFREYLKTAMEITRITEISAIDKSFIAKLLIERDEAVMIDDDLLLPPEFVRVKTTTAPDKAEIKRAIKAGIEVPGARIQKNNRLEIK